MPAETRPSNPIPRADLKTTSIKGYLLLDRLAREKGRTLEDIVAKSTRNDPVKQGIVVDFVYQAQTSVEPLSKVEILSTLQRKSLPEYAIVRVKDRIRNKQLPNP